MTTMIFDISTKLLFNAVDTLTSMSSIAHTGILLNLGDTNDACEQLKEPDWLSDSHSRC
jgi:hypothetical protein